MKFYARCDLRIEGIATVATREIEADSLEAAEHLALDQVLGVAVALKSNVSITLSISEKIRGEQDVTL